MTRASRRKFHITYKTVCIDTGRFYIGMHSTDDLNDEYLGSGVRLRRSIKKYGSEQHKREILGIFPTRLLAAENEIQLLSEEVRSDPLCLNCAPGGLGLLDRTFDTEETRRKRIAASLRMHESMSDEQRAQRSKAISAANKIALNRPETQLLRSEAAKKRWEDPEYRQRMSAIISNRKHSEEARAKMAAAKLGKKLKRSAEHNAKIAAAHKARWARKKEANETR